MLRRPTSSADRSASSAEAGSRRSTCRALVTWSMTAPNPCPTKSWTSRAIRRRSASSACWASCAAWRRAPRSVAPGAQKHDPGTKGRRCPRSRYPRPPRTDPERRPQNGRGRRRSPSAAAALSDTDQRPTTKASRETSNMSGSSPPERCATTTGTITATETANSGTPGTKTHKPKATTGIATNTRSGVDDGSTSGAMTATATAKTATRRRSSSARDVASPDPPVTPRMYCAALPSTSSPGPGQGPQPWTDSASETTITCWLESGRRAPAPLVAVLGARSYSRTSGDRCLKKTAPI